MSPSDFICDVDTSALRCLTPTEYLFFDGVLRHKNPGLITALITKLGRKRFASVKQRVQLKLGRSLKARGVWPVSAYFQPVDCR